MKTMTTKNTTMSSITMRRTTTVTKIKMPMATMLMKKSHSMRTRSRKSIISSPKDHSIGIDMIRLLSIVTIGCIIKTT